MSQLWKLFATFFKIGGFTFGGGYAMLPIIEDALVTKNKWLSREEFLDLFAVAQSLPGVFAVNISLFLGYKLKGIRGAIISALGTTLPSFLVILAIAMYFATFKDNPIVIKIFNGIRPAVVAMIAAPVITTWRSMKMKRSALWIPILSCFLVWYMGVSPVLIIVASAFLGILYTFYIKKLIKRKVSSEDDSSNNNQQQSK
ncbi:chromate transporter [Falsiporphyromonas endometrii]|uniref:Chromate transporter n=1 Tax=Falsiporphyromonas endometrii TaxID=1387297 RepID=A0ABV9K6X5_9PORP